MPEEFDFGVDWLPVSAPNAVACCVASGSATPDVSGLGAGGCGSGSAAGAVFTMGAGAGGGGAGAVTGAKMGAMFSTTLPLSLITVPDFAI
ncbi:MAG: hypothetical protein AB9M53_10060 [Leptothrix sp. (in: b-proteobacteria)]